MFTIGFCDVKETLEIGELFDQLSFSQDVEQTDDSGDSFLQSSWGIEVESLDSYYPIEGFRWTTKEKQVKLTLASNEELICSPEHIVLRQDPNVWSKIDGLKPGDSLATKTGVSNIASIEPLVEETRLCDMQVAISHSYYTNNILSHNSHFLVQAAAAAILNNLNVIYYTFELKDSLVGLRFDSHFCDIDSNLLIDLKEEVLKKYENMKLGRLFIKEYPTNTCSVQMMRAHLEKLLLTRDFKPDLVVIDYADIMKSSRHFDSLRHELKLVYEELRSMSQELSIPIWTASQSNKEGSQSDIVDLSNMSEAYGKAFVADVIVTLSRKATEKATGFGRLFLAKSRAGKDGIVFPVHINTARSKFRIIGDSGSFEEAKSENESEMKKRLKEKWKELKDDSKLAEKKQVTVDTSENDAQ